MVKHLTEFLINNYEPGNLIRVAGLWDKDGSGGPATSGDYAGDYPDNPIVLEEETTGIDFDCCQFQFEGQLEDQVKEVDSYVLGASTSTATPPGNATICVGAWRWSGGLAPKGSVAHPKSVSQDGNCLTRPVVLERIVG
jgi:hypothetical protein